MNCEPLEVREDFTCVSTLPKVGHMRYTPWRGKYDTMPYYENTIRFQGLDGKWCQADFSDHGDISVWIVFCE